jgi:phage terminase large subunit-like protein
VEEFPQTPANLTAASQNLFELIQGGNLAVYPDAAMRLAISRAVAIETPRGWRIAKEKQSHKIDVVVGLAMACHAAVEQQANVPMVIPPSVIARLQAMGPYRRSYGDDRAANAMAQVGERRYLQQQMVRDRKLYGW